MQFEKSRSFIYVVSYVYKCIIKFFVCGAQLTVCDESFELFAFGKARRSQSKNIYYTRGKTELVLGF